MYRGRDEDHSEKYKLTFIKKKKKMTCCKKTYLLEYFSITTDETDIGNRQNILNILGPRKY